jgi:hypothetical protein
MSTSAQAFINASLSDILTFALTIDVNAKNNDMLTICNHSFSVTTYTLEEWKDEFNNTKVFSTVVSSMDYQLISRDIVKKIAIKFKGIFKPDEWTETCKNYGLNYDLRKKII